MVTVEAAPTGWCDGRRRVCTGIKIEDSSENSQKGKHPVIVPGAIGALLRISLATAPSFPAHPPPTGMVRNEDVSELPGELHASLDKLEANGINLLKRREPGSDGHLLQLADPLVEKILPDIRASSNKKIVIVCVNSSNLEIRLEDAQQAIDIMPSDSAGSFDDDVRKTVAEFDPAKSVPFIVAWISLATLQTRTYLFIHDFATEM